FIKEALNAPVVAVDTENTSLDPERAKVWIVGLATSASRAIAIPFHGMGGKPYWSPENKARINKRLNYLFATKTLRFQNAKYDIRVLRKNGFRLEGTAGIEDTMLLHHAIHPELPHNIGFIVSIYGKTPYWKDIDWKEPLAYKDQLELRRYNCRDCTVLHQAWQPMLDDLAENSSNARVYHDISSKLIMPIVHMEEGGIKLSTSRLTKWKSDMDLQLKDLEITLRTKALLPSPFNLDSGMDLRLLLYGEIGSKYLNAAKLLEEKYGPDSKLRHDTKKYKEAVSRVNTFHNTSQLWDYHGWTPRRTKHGSTSADEDARLSMQRAATKRLEYLQNIKRRKPEHETEQSQIQRLLEWLPLYGNYEVTGKLRSTYTDFRVSQDGLVHFNFKQHGTASGRLSSGDKKRLGVGNAQNVPEVARRIFIAGKGHKFFGRDYSNLELRIAAYLTGEPALIKAFEEGKNVHDLNTQIMFGIDKDHPLWPHARQAVKEAYDFGRLLYGASLERTYTEILLKVPALNLTMKRLKEIDTRLMGAYPRLAEWQQELRAEVVRTRKMSNGFGRTRIFRGDPHEVEREGLNHPIQSTAADIVNQAMIDVDKQFQIASSKCKIVLQIHDELICRTILDQIDPGMNVLKACMEKPVVLQPALVGNFTKDMKPITISFPTEGHIGDDWGQLK
ncbi:hypothetical protein KAR91_26595, partial [Candidatus Pacearchaeota archaeon]|nr:hypothetical protein [Candidatus Pacearchaeota archaeon]